MKIIVKLIVNYLLDFIKNFLYNRKLNKINKEIIKAKEEADNAQKDSDSNYNDFMLKYARYRAELQRSPESVREGSGKTAVDGGQEKSTDSKTGNEE